MTLIAWVKSFFSWLWNNRLRLLLSMISAVIFAVLIFPFNDLSDLLSSQISAATRNSVYVQFERLSLSFFPQLGAQAEQVHIESLFFPGIKVEEVTVTPSLGAALSQKPYGHVTAKGLFRGDVDARMGSGGQSERGTELQKLEITAQRLSLQDLRQLANLPALIKGRLDLETAGLIDMTLAEQPDLALNIKIQQFEMPSTNLALGHMGELTLPEIKLSSLELKGRLSAGRLLIENIRVGGQPADDLQGTIKGTLGLNLRNAGGTPVPEFGAYSFDVDLQPSANFRERAKFFLEFLTAYQQNGRIRMKLSGTHFGPAPSMAPLR
ncbi:MAG: type II secretion system protein GspN [Bdellovibrionaceae bacterium]|nr:type II secretion system protein GspN [Pseudobdellovibrionaceae bacterium]